ncbi:MAG: ATP-binding protein [Bacteroidota bacterium]
MVLKSEIEKAVLSQRRLLTKRSTGLERVKAGNIELSTDTVLIITGIRRCGKSTLMHQIAKKQTHRAWFNFEDSRIVDFEISDFTKLQEVFGEEAQHYYFDEIQNVDEWEVFIRQLHDEEKAICITGSNASLLSRELGTKLTGRNRQIELFPFSFSEYCSFQKKEQTALTFKEYITDGGFPGYLKNKQKDYLQQLFKDILYRDIIVRHGIRNPNTVLEIALFLISNVGKEYSLNSLRKTFDVGSVNSVASYVSWLEDAYILFSVPKFSWSLKEVAINRKKVYTIDPGFAQANSFSYTEDIGRLFENVIYLELRRRYKDIYYFRDKGECDFVVMSSKKAAHILQVCSEVHPDNLQREMNGLIEALAYFNKKEGSIITMNQEDVLKKDGKQINLIPAHKWLKALDNQ